MAQNIDVEKSNDMSDNPAPSSMADIVSSEVMPEVQDSAIEAVQAQRSENAEPEQTPAQTKVKKKRGRPIGSGKTKSQLHTGETAVSSQTAAQPAGTVSVDSTVAAMTISGLIERTQIGVLGNDFIYNEIERTQNREAWKNCLDYYGGLNLPPPLALAADHMAIIMARATKPAVQSRFQLLKAWVTGKLEKIRSKKNAQPDNRPDDERQDNVRCEKSNRTSK